MEYICHYQHHRLTLPQELVELVVGGIENKKDLYTCRLINKAFSASALYHLYSTITIKGGHTALALFNASQCVGLSAILESPTIMQSIKAIEIIHSAYLASSVPRTADSQGDCDSASSYHQLSPQPSGMVRKNMLLLQFITSEHLKLQKLVIRGPMLLSSYPGSLHWYRDVPSGLQHAFAKLGRSSLLKTLVISNLTGIYASWLRNFTSLTSLVIKDCGGLTIYTSYNIDLTTSNLSEILTRKPTDGSSKLETLAITIENLPVLLTSLATGKQAGGHGTVSLSSLRTVFVRDDGCAQPSVKWLNILLTACSTTLENVEYDQISSQGNPSTNRHVLQLGCLKRLKTVTLRTKSDRSSVQWIIDVLTGAAKGHLAHVHIVVNMRRMGFIYPSPVHLAQLASLLSTIPTLKKVAIQLESCSQGPDMADLWKIAFAHMFGKVERNTSQLDIVTIPEADRKAQFLTSRFNLALLSRPP